MNLTRYKLEPRQVVALLVVAVALAALPPIVGGYWTRILTFCAIYSVAAAGAQVLYGRLGFVSLNQVALVGVGRLGLPPHRARGVPATSHSPPARAAPSPRRLACSSGSRACG